MKKCLGVVLALLLLMPCVASAIEFENVKFGGQVRLRGYAIENFFDFNDNTLPVDVDNNYDAFRLKASVFTKVDVGDNITGFVQLTDQNYGENNTDDWEDDNKTNHVFIDNAYIKVKNVLGPFSLKLGRQNVIYGSGFVLLDGQSQFASTSIYFDGVKASWDITDKITLDALYLKDQENGTSADDDTTLSGLYLTAKNGWCPYFSGQQEVYALNREDENDLQGTTTESQKDIWMFGVRLSDKLECGLDYAGEVAMQVGTAYDGCDQNATGYKFDLGYSFNLGDLKPRIFGQYVLLSGDEDDTGNDFEGWDVFYGGWPQFGDLLAWKYVNVVHPALGQLNAIPGPNNGNDSMSSYGGEADYSNLEIMTIGVGFGIDDKIFPKVSVSKLKFDETAAYNLPDDDFGNYYQLNVKYVYSKALSFGAYYAIIEPGDAFPNNQDNASEFFWEAELKF